MNILLPKKTKEYRELIRQGYIENPIIFMLDVLTREFKRDATIKIVLENKERKIQ